ncbi:MAG TPA: cytochrome P450 [Thermoplasmataceae archaeon]|nr:cytochrome P450 [Thermoplasmataceae archaeon]
MEKITRDALNPFPWYEMMREKNPVFYDDKSGFWHVFRYPDVKRVLSDYSYFSSAEGRGGSEENPIGASLISSDPPRHTKLRSLVSKAFTPKRVNELAPRIREVAEELISGFREGGKFDLVNDYSGQLPVIVIAELLGIPPEDRGKFKKWSDQLVSGARDNFSDEGGGYSEPQIAMGMYFNEIIEQKRKEPGNDLISSLIEAEVDGEKLSHFDLLGFSVLLLVAGNETTTNLITNAILTLDRNPADYGKVLENPDLIPSAIEEVLRYRSPVQSMFRTCAKDTEIGGHKLKKGQPLIAWIGSANHDPSEFNEPETFDPERSPNRHIAFGEGIHFCLGAPLARLEAKIALEVLFNSIGRPIIDKDARLEPIGGIVVYGVKSLPVTF